ncbi:phage major capsid protein [Enterococcus faecium]|uniref:hypothetical protein n=1 Tax=Enterococcus faecium TaxID=1352 RepID=UPI001F2FC401|nr:hypothetical protein [Enterococcus faecium]
MKVAQIYDIINSVTKETLGETAVVKEDLTNIVDIGKEIIDADSVDSYVKKLVNHIGKVIFVDRLYKGNAPSVLMDSWEFGSVTEKISTNLPDAHESDTWKLEDGKDYSPNVFYEPKVSVKFFNKRVTFEIPLSFTELQVKQSFSNVTQLNSFLSMLYTSVENSMTVKLDDLIMRTINNMTAETVASNDKVRAVDLLARYNAEKGTNLTDVQALKDPEFIRYASYTIAVYKDRLSKISTLFNEGKQARFTPEDKLHIVLLSDFAKASDVYLQSDTFHNEMTELPLHETVPYWQGSGTDYDFKSITKIDVKTSTGKTVSQTGILGVMFDRDALGVSNLDRRVTTNYNAKAEFFNNFYKMDAGYYNDLNENFVVFYVGAGTEEAGK